MTVAIYPGTFDPITKGHLDIATRAAKLFERLIIAVYESPEKHPIFDIEERVELVRRTIVHLPNVEVRSFNVLTVALAKRMKATAMVRVLRMSADFEREFEMEVMKRVWYPEMEQGGRMVRMEYQFLSATLLKEAVSLGGDISDLVAEHVATALRKKVGSEM